MSAGRVGAVRTRGAIVVGKAARYATRLRGGGSAWPGLVAERIDPGFLASTLADLPGGIVVVTGTNGKTTTTKMLAELLRAHGRRVLSNPTGSNFTRGVVSSLLGEIDLRGRFDADLAVLELDEAHALEFAKVITPTHALLLNVARDQLDRFAEIDATARLLRRLAEQTRHTVVLNSDDPFVSRIATEVADDVQVEWFGIDPEIAASLPSMAALHETDVRDPPHADVERAAVLLRPLDERSFDLVVRGEHIGPVTLRQRGLAAMINATAATAMARALLGTDFDAATTVTALAAVAPPFGRGEVIDVDGQPLELVLVKNPAGFTVALDTYGSTPVATMVAINDNYADGEDVSWLYDVSFEPLRARGVALTSGVRAYDMALRLHLDDVAVDEVECDLDRALDRFLAVTPTEPKRIFCTYTAMMALRRTLAGRYALSAFGEDPP